MDNKDNACVATQIGNNKKKNAPPRCHVGEWVETTEESHFLYQGPNLLGEYDTNGQSQQEIIWLGNTPVAALQDNQLYQIHTDHLETPVLITDSANTVVWRWDRRPFGDTAANDDPDGDGQAFVFNLRFPGQYFDLETELHYNYFRDYDPSVGRYVQSDPVGLRGGVNTYGYANQNPLMYIDPIGNAAIAPALPWLIPLGQAVIDTIAVGLGISMLMDDPTDDPADDSQECETQSARRCQLHSQNRIGLPPGRIRCTYLCPLGSGGRGFITRIIDGNSCPAEVDWVPGDHGY